MSDPTPTVLPDEIVVTRLPGETHGLTVVIDGQPLPWFIATDPPPVMTLDPSSSPGVTVTLIAKHVRMDDQLLEGADLAGHTHQDDPSEVVAE